MVYVQGGISRISLFVFSHIPKLEQGVVMKEWLFPCK